MSLEKLNPDFQSWMDNVSLHVFDKPDFPPMYDSPPPLDGCSIFEHFHTGVKQVARSTELPVCKEVRWGLWHRQDIYQPIKVTQHTILYPLGWYIDLYSEEDSGS